MEDSVQIDVGVFADIVESLWELERFASKKAKEGKENKKGEFNSGWLYSASEISRIGAYAWSYISEEDREKVKKYLKDK